MARSQPTQKQGKSNSVGDEVADAVMKGIGELLLAAIRGLWALVVWAVLFPIISVPLIACAGLAYWQGWPNGLAGLIVFAGALIAWRLRSPVGFHQVVSGPMWKRWRRWAAYTRTWAKTCALHGFTTPLDDDVLVPWLKKVTAGYQHDLLTVRLLPGQSTTDWQAQAEALAHAFRAPMVRVRPLAPGWITIEVQHTDALATPIAMPAPTEVVDLESVPIGVTETGRDWIVRLRDRHLLVAGATGAGKGSVVWSILAGIAPTIHTGLVKIWIIDPKGGMEFGAGAPLFDRFAYDAGDDTLTLLRDAATVLTERATRLRGVTRQHAPTIDEPLLVVVIDEIAALTAYLTDRKIKTEVEQLLGLLLSQGRAVGISVVACVQDPSKDVLALRQLFPIRIGLRLAEATQTTMTLGQAARDRGAVCELIPDSTPGVGYVVEDGSNEVERVRAFHITDDDIAYLTTHYPTPRSGDPLEAA